MSAVLDRVLCGEPDESLVAAEAGGKAEKGQTPHGVEPSSCGDKRGGKGGLLFEGFLQLEAVVELADHAVEKIALSGCVPVSVLVTASPVLGTCSG
jgi:hypothetical protein